jgi:hypothetical protein
MSSPTMASSTNSTHLSKKRLNNWIKQPAFEQTKLNFQIKAVYLTRNHFELGLLLTKVPCMA